MSYTGRLGTIVANARIHFNESTAKNISDAQFLAFILTAYREVARHAYWRRESTIDAVADQYIYDLDALLTRFNRLHELWWYEDSAPMEEIPNKTTFERIKRRESYNTTVDTPRIWTVQTNQLYVYPTPTASVSAAFRTFDSYYPDDLVSGAVTEDITGDITIYTKDGTAKGHFDEVNSDVIVGAFVVFSDATYRTVIAKTGDGTAASNITLSSDHATGAVSNIYGLDYATNVTPEWPEQYDDFLTEMACHYVWQRDSDSGQAQWWFQKSRETLRQLLRQNQATAASVRPG